MAAGKRPAYRRPRRTTHRAGRRAAKPAHGTRTAAPRRVSTGRGPGPAQIGADLVALFNAGRGSEVEAKWWSPRIVSVEGMGLAWHGRKAVEEKNRGWMTSHTVLGASAEGPYVGAAGFAVKFRIQVRDNATGAESHAEEVGVYTVRDGQIVREEFMGSAGQ